MKAIVLTVPEPCYENWNKMTAAEKGRYCDSCKKEVVDFSLMNDADVASYFSKASEKICGRFDESQVNRTLTPVKQDRSIFKHLWKLLLPGFFFSAKAFAQKTAPQGLQLKDSLVRTNPKPLILGMVARKIVPQEINEQIITGQLVDAETQIPLPGVLIQIKGTSKGTVTDSLGNFSYKFIKKNKNDNLIISSVGYATREVAVKDLLSQKEQVIKLKMQAITLGEAVVTRIPAGKKTKTTIVKTSTVKETYPVLNDEVKIYPNPVAASASCSLSFSKVDKGNFTAQITDINGRMIQQSVFYVPGENYLFRLDLNKEVIAGAYLLRIVNSAGKLFYNGKIVVE